MNIRFELDKKNKYNSNKNANNLIAVYIYINSKNIKIIIYFKQKL